MVGFSNPDLLEVACYTRSGDGQYWLRYPNGDKPFPGIFSDASASAAASGNLRVPKPLAGAATVASAVSGILTGGVNPPPGGPVKWNPGRGVESNTVLQLNQGLATIKSEINLIANADNIITYMILVTWANLQQIANTYTWGNLDGVVDYLTNRNGNSAMHKPKRWVLQIVSGSFTSTHPNAGGYSIVPQYLQQNPGTYGQAGYRVAGVVTQPSGVGAWWGGDGNGNTYSAALWRPSVSAEYIKLWQAALARYNSDPMFEGIYQGEDSFYTGTGSDNGADYNDTTARINWQNLLAASCAAGPNTNVMFSETFLRVQPNSIALTNNITDGSFTNHPPMLAQTDSLGAVQRSVTHTWGTQTYTGQLGSLGDRRSSLRFVAEIQAPDQGFYINLGSDRADILDGLNQMKCTHDFWAIVQSPTAVSTKPAKYPCTFTAPPTGLSGTLASVWPLTSGTYDFVTTAGGRATFTKGSKNVTFSTAQSSTGNVVNINLPLIPFNWATGGTATAAQNGTSSSYTDAGLIAWLNDPANALTNLGYPPDYPTS
jgi:hypothetical protein